MIKTVTGQTRVFEWTAPGPLDGAPIMTVGSSSPVTLTQTRADATVTAIANDRRTLTVNSQASALQADQLKAYLVTDGDSIYSVTVVRMVGTTAILAEPLPREIDLSVSALLVFGMWYGTIPSTITNTSGYYPLQVSYQLDLGQQTQSKLEKGLLKVTPRPFDTGLSHDELVAQFPQLADMIPRRQSSFEPQIEATLQEIILMLRDHLKDEPDVTEDEVFNAGSFMNAHAYCTAARVYEMIGQMDNANVMRQRCEDLMDISLRSLALDRDGDNVVDDNELDVAKKGGSARDLRASWSSYNKSEYDKTFTPTRGMRH
jgi:hypothetical protein